MAEATQEGASVHDQLMARLVPEEVSQETEEETEEQTDEVKAQAEIESEAQEEPEAEAQAPEAEEVSEDAVEEETEPQIELSDLAGYLGIEADRLDVDDDGAVLVRTKIDGEEGNAKFSDLIKSHQLEGHLNKQNMEVVEAKKALETRQSELESQSQAKFEEAETLIGIAMNELTQEYEKVDWNGLRTEEPAEYAALQSDYAARKQVISDALGKVQLEKQQQETQYSQELQTHLQAEDAKLYKAVDGWDNAETAKQEFSDVMSYLQNSYGYSTENLYGTYDQSGRLVQPGISDHKIVVMARKAMLYDQLQQAKPVVNKKVRKAPKIAKPGAAKKVDPDAKKREELRRKIKQTGGKQGSVAAYLMETGKV